MAARTGPPALQAEDSRDGQPVSFLRIYLFAKLQNFQPRRLAETDQASADDESARRVETPDVVRQKKQLMMKSVHAVVWSGWRRHLEPEAPAGKLPEF